MIKIILVPVDGSERSAQVLDTALVIAKRFDAHIKVVHVRERSLEPFNLPAAYRELRRSPLPLVLLLRDRRICG